jgi:hypothetical protein
MISAADVEQGVKAAVARKWGGVGVQLLVDSIEQLAVDLWQATQYDREPVWLDGLDDTETAVIA